MLGPLWFPAVTAPLVAVKVTVKWSASMSVTLSKLAPVKTSGVSSDVVTLVGTVTTGASSTAATVIEIVESAVNGLAVSVSTVWILIVAGPLYSAAGLKLNDASCEDTSDGDPVNVIDEDVEPPAVNVP